MSEFKARIVAELDTAKLNQQIQELQNKNINLNVKTDNATKEAQKNINNIDKAVKQTTKSADTFGQKLKNALGIGSAAALVYKGISLIKQAANNAVNSVKELNQSLTNLRIVTNASESEAEQYMNTYNSMAQSLGATTTEVADTATGWLRQGKSIAETNQLINDSIKLSKIGMINSADATQYLTSALNGYRLEASQASDVVDKLAKLDSAAAITASGLAEGMSRTANTARDAGVSMDELLAYLAVIGETTQKSMSSVGESLKTVFTRMSNVKLGKIDFTNEDGTTESLSDVETVLNQLDIKLRATNNEFRDFSDVLAEVGSKWTNKAKWFYDWQGTRYESNLNQKDSAIQDIIRKIENQNGGRFPASAATIYGQIKHYAKGTRNSVGGLSITQEDGFEAIFQKLQNGEYTMMPKGSQVFNSDMTDNLYNFSADPQKFMSEIASKFNYSNYLDSRQGDIDRTIKQVASNYNQNNIGDITVNSAPIYIQGDATQSTIKALKAESDKIVDKATKNVMNIALRNKRLI